jgi:hypothetical protein
VTACVMTPCRSWGCGWRIGLTVRGCEHGGGGGGGRMEERTSGEGGGAVEYVCH